MKIKKLLLLGFSCTDTSDGYASFLIEKLRAAQPNLEIVRCALGGLAPPVIAATLRNIISADQEITHVIFEISTSIYPWLPTSNITQAKKIVKDALSAAIESDVQPFILILHRQEAEKQLVDFNEILRAEAIEHDVSYLDLSSNIDHIFGKNWFERHYRDGVHTNEAGGRSQAGFIFASISAFLERKAKARELISPPEWKTTAISIAELAGKPHSGLFRRKEYERGYLTMSETEVVELNFINPMLVHGLSFIMGPWSGNFRLTQSYNGQKESKLVSAIDERSYYPRLGYRALRGNEPVKLTSVQMQFSDRADDIKLIKCDKVNNPCDIKLVDLFVSVGD